MDVDRRLALLESRVTFLMKMTEIVRREFSDWFRKVRRLLVTLLVLYGCAVLLLAFCAPVRARVCSATTAVRVVDKIAGYLMKEGG